MNNYKFYTPLGVAEQLLNLLPKRKYNRIIDICCGSWNLLCAAKEKYPTARFTGVDIDEEASMNCFANADFFAKDGREFALEAYKDHSVYDLILSNPPFGYLKDTDRMFKNSQSEYILQGLNNKRYENEMMQANLLLADNQSIMIFILPSTFVEGDNSIKVRCSIAKEYRIRKLVKLPLETFGCREINTYAVIMQKHNKKNNYSTDLHEMTFDNSGYKIITRGVINSSKIIHGEWINKLRSSENKSDICSFRGNISSSQLTKEGLKVLHCSSNISENAWKPATRYCNDNSKITRCNKTQPGDIIVNRVGKCAGYWYVNIEDAYISDCLIVFRSAKQKELLRGFEENSINGKLNIPVKGVSTRYISASDIKAII